MFVGHFGVGFGAKAAAPRVSLGWLLLAAELPDLLFGLFVLAGIERVRIVPGITRVTPLDLEYYPFSHSLLAMAIWGLVLCLAYAALRRDREGGLVLAGVVVSHWVLDFISHRPDMPVLISVGPRVGLGLWNSLAGTLLFELLVFAVGIALYLRATRPRDRTGTWALWGLVALLTVVYLGSVFGSPPPEARAFAAVGQATWLLVAWGFWIDRHREVRTA